MNITHIKIRKAINESRMRAIVSIIIDDEFAIHDIKVIEGDSKLFLAMPSRRLPEGTFRDICHPTNTETRAYLEKEIINKYIEHINTENLVTASDSIAEETNTA